MAGDKFTWEENDLKIEHPTGSGIFIPMREFNRLIAEERARKKAAQAADGKTDAEEETGEGRPG